MSLGEGSSSKPSGLSEPGVREGGGRGGSTPLPIHILANQLTAYTNPITDSPQDFKTFLRPWHDMFFAHQTCFYTNAGVGGDDKKCAVLLPS